MNILIVYDPTSKQIKNIIQHLTQQLSPNHNIHTVQAGKEQVTNIIQYDFVLAMIPQWNYRTKRNITQFFKQHEFPLYTPGAFISNDAIKKENITDHIHDIFENAGLSLISTYTLQPSMSLDQYQQKIEEFTHSLNHDLNSYKNT